MLQVAVQMSSMPGLSGNKLLKFLGPSLIGNESTSQVDKITDPLNLLKHADGSLSNYTNLHRVNDIQGINKFFRTVNEKLQDSGTFIGCVETLEQRRDRLFKKFPPVLNGLYYTLDFVYPM
jgi:hypothetical protein